MTATLDDLTLTNYRDTPDRLVSFNCSKCGRKKSYRGDALMCARCDVPGDIDRRGERQIVLSNEDFGSERQVVTPFSGPSDGFQAKAQDIEKAPSTQGEAETETQTSDAESPTASPGSSSELTEQPKRGPGRPRKV